MDWVTLATFWSVEEAQLALAFLQSEEIPCRLDGEAVAGNLWHLANATGGVKLMVARDSAQRAAELLAAVPHHQELVGPEPEQPAYDSVADEAEIRRDSESTDHESTWDDVNEQDSPGLLDRLRLRKRLVILILLAPIWIPLLIVIGGTMVLFLNRLVG